MNINAVYSYYALQILPRKNHDHLPSMNKRPKTQTYLGFRDLVRGAAIWAKTTPAIFNFESASILHIFIQSTFNFPDKNISCVICILTRSCLLPFLQMRKVFPSLS